MQLEVKKRKTIDDRSIFVNLAMNLPREGAKANAVPARAIEAKAAKME